MSSCSIQTLSPQLKKLFQNNVESFSSDIIVIGLMSGLVIWFCSNTPVKGPIVLCHTHQTIEAIHWMKDEDGMCTLLLIVLSSGQMIVYGSKGRETLHLPDSVKSSLCLKDHLITSNGRDCYVSKLQTDGTCCLNSATYPVKGVQALASIPSSTSIIAASLHGALYFLNPLIKLSGDPFQFAMPDQNLLDNLYTLTKSLEHIYEESNKEDSITKATIAAVIGRKYPALFKFSIEVISDKTFSVTVKLTRNDECITFSNKLWLACTEVFDERNIRENNMMQLKEDLNGVRQLTLFVNNSLLFGSVVTVYLVAMIDSQLPSLEVQLGKVEIDACHLMINYLPNQNVICTEDCLSNVLRSINNNPAKNNLQECKLTLQLPNERNLNPPLAIILQDSQHSFSVDEWNKISSGKKQNVQISVNGILALLNVECETKELRITCCDVQICHKIKETILKRVSAGSRTNISEDVFLKIQALYQSFEILKLKEGPDISALESIKEKLRETITPHFL